VITRSDTWLYLFAFFASGRWLFLYGLSYSLVKVVK
jgi:hypothetical protein